MWVEKLTLYILSCVHLVVFDECVVFVGEDLPFPDSYPVSCLLGCVDVVDVIPQDEYRHQV